MGAAHPSASDAATDPSKQRHGGDGTDPADASGEDKRGTTARVSPITRLYRHALESVFGFLTLEDLSRVLAVKRGWSAAVRSTKSLALEE